MNETDINVLKASGDLDCTRAHTELHLADGRVLRLDTRLLSDEDSSPQVYPPTRADMVELGESVTIPLIEERMTVGKQVVETGKVRLQKTVQEYTEQLDEPLAVRTFDVERVILNQPVETAPGIRQEGDTTIYPVVEEQLVLTKRLILTEEVRVTRRDTERRDNQVVTLHREHLVVERETTTHSS